MSEASTVWWTLWCAIRPPSRRDLSPSCWACPPPAALNVSPCRGASAAESTMVRGITMTRDWWPQRYKSPAISAQLRTALHTILAPRGAGHTCTAAALLPLWLLLSSPGGHRHSSHGCFFINFLLPGDPILLAMTSICKKQVNRGWVPHSKQMLCPPRALNAP